MSRKDFSQYPAPVQKGKKGLVIGTFIALAGAVFLFREILPGVLPHFLFTWYFTLIVLGVLIGVYDNFKGNAWWILILIGSFFGLSPILGDWFADYNIRVKRLFLPVLLIILGGLMVLKARKKTNYNYNYQEPKPQDNTDSPFENVANRPASNASSNGVLLAPASSTSEENENAQDAQNAKQEGGEQQKHYGINDVIKLNSFFASNEESIMSKNFMGGGINCAFGSVVLDLRYADFKSVVAIDILCLFGSVEIFVPANWSIKNETTAMLGSTEDQRRNNNLNEPNKILIVKGFVGFGSIEFRS